MEITASLVRGSAPGKNPAENGGRPAEDTGWAGEMGPGDALGSPVKRAWNRSPGSRGTRAGAAARGTPSHRPADHHGVRVPGPTPP